MRYGRLMLVGAVAIIVASAIEDKLNMMPHSLETTSPPELSSGSGLYGRLNQQ